MGGQDSSWVPWWIIVLKSLLFTDRCQFFAGAGERDVLCGHDASAFFVVFSVCVYI